MKPAKGSCFIERGDIYLLEVDAGRREPPADGTPAGGGPLDGAPAGNRLADDHPAGAPADDRAADGSPAGSRSADEPPADGSPAERPQEPERRPVDRERAMQPVLVIQNDVGNRFGSSVIVVPLLPGRRLKNTLLGVLLTSGGGNGLPEDRVALFSQIMTVDKSLFRRDNFMGRPDDEALRRVDEAIKLSLGLSTIQHLETKQKLLRKWRLFRREKNKVC